jgi:hypothetical protein
MEKSEDSFSLENESEKEKRDETEENEEKQKKTAFEGSQKSEETKENEENAGENRMFSLKKNLGKTLQELDCTGSPFWIVIEGRSLEFSFGDAFKKEDKLLVRT